MSRVLITGAAGAVGSALLEELSATPHKVLATDIRRPGNLPDNAEFSEMDVRGEDPLRVIAAFRPEVIIHLASIVTPGDASTRALEYAVDVTGSQNVLGAAIDHGVRRLVVTSSGAAYGYHADNPLPLTEDTSCRGNPEFAYADHKRQVEEMLATARAEHPNLEQVVLRVGTVLGAGLENQITALFHKKRLLMIRGHDSPFVFIWTRDLARILVRAISEGKPGLYNVAGDGAMTLPDIATALGKPLLRLPASFLKGLLAVARPLGLSRYGPEQVRFLQYRPVLDNRALKSDFGYQPELTSEEVFHLWQREAGL